MNQKSHVGMTQCFFCCEPKDVLLDRRLKDTLPRIMLVDLEPCQKCKEYMEAGVMFIAFDEEQTDFDNTVELPNPDYNFKTDTRKLIDTGIPNFYRTGQIAVITDEGVERRREAINHPTAVDEALKQRFMFVPHVAWASLGLPVEEINNMPELQEASDEPEGSD